MPLDNSVAAAYAVRSSRCGDGPPGPDRQHGQDDQLPGAGTAGAAPARPSARRAQPSGPCLPGEPSRPIIPHGRIPTRQPARYRRDTPAMDPAQGASGAVVTRAARFITAPFWPQARTGSRLGGARSYPAIDRGHLGRREHDQKARCDAGECRSAGASASLGGVAASAPPLRPVVLKFAIPGGRDCALTTGITEAITIQYIGRT
jgi:hypothetical protein